MTTENDANNFCPLHITCANAHAMLLRELDGSADQHQCPSVVLVRPLRDLQETFCAGYSTSPRNENPADANHLEICLSVPQKNRN